MENDFEHCGLACEVFLAVICGEGHVDIKLISDVLADNLILKAGNEAAGAESEIIFLSFAAFESDTVYKAFEIDDRDISVFCGTVGYFKHSAVGTSCLIDLTGDILVGDDSRLLFDFEFSVIHNGCDGLCPDLCDDDNAFVVDLFDIKLVASCIVISSASCIRD